MTFRAKIILLTTAAMLLFAGLVLVSVNRLTKRTFSSYLSQRERQEAQRLLPFFEQWYAENGSWRGIENIFSSRGPGMMYGRSRSGRTMGRGGTRIVITDSEKIAVFDSFSALTGQVMTAEGFDIRQGSRTVGYLFFGEMIGQGLSPEARNFLYNANFSILLITLVLLTGVVIVLSLATRRLFSPLTILAKSAEEIARGDYSVRIPPAGKNEIGAASGAFNRMAKELEEKELWRDQLLSNISHELRTPLTLLRGELEMMMEGLRAPETESLQSLYSETDILLTLADELRSLSEKDQPRHSHLLELKSVLEEVEKRYETAIRKANVSFTLEGSPIQSSGNRISLIRLFSNLMDNSLRHLPDDGTGRVEISIQNDSKNIRILFRDNGPGIPENLREKVFERFFRTDEERTRNKGGRGLGLAICRDIAQKHGGGICLIPSSDRGAIFLVELPVKRP